jgi:ketosteroid isomerase-like protein
MSQENVERARRAIDAFNGHDLDGVLAFIDPSIEFRSRIVELEGGGPYRGHDGIRKWWEDVFTVFPDFCTEIEELEDVGDRTLARVRAHTHGPQEDSPADQTQWHLTEWQEGKVVRWRVFLNEDEALEAAGLSE